MFVLVVAVVGTLIPTALYVLLVWWLDRYEKEPLWLLGLAFLWGAGPAALLSLALEHLLVGSLAAVGGQGLAFTLAGTGLGAPVIEETLKGIALVGLVLVFLREFDDVLDGIIYGAMIGFGFAFSENVFAYFLPTLDQQAVGAGLALVFMRTTVFGANHAFWTGIIGAAVGYARLAKTWRRRLLVPAAGWGLAVLFHSLHNLGTTMLQQGAWLYLGLSVLVDWGGVLLLLLIAGSALRRECHWIERGLSEEVRQGALSVEEYDVLRSAGRRLRLQWEAYKLGGRTASRTVGRYFQSATELAFSKRHARAGGLESHRMAEIERLQQELAAARSRAWPWLGVSQQLPNSLD